MEQNKQRVLAISLAVAVFFAWGAVAFGQNSILFPLDSARPAPSEPYISISPDTFYTLEDAFFLVGRSDPKALVRLTLTKQGELPVKFTIYADSNGEWTVSEERVYLAAGNWEVRATQQVGAQISGSSNPRVIRSIVTGITLFGISIRYTIIATVVFIFIAILAFVFFYFQRKIRALQKGLLEKQLRETEDRFHRGFTEIRKDLMDQLKDLAAGTSGRPLTPDEISKRDHILREIEEIEKNLEHDVTDIGRRYS